MKKLLYLFPFYCLLLATSCGDDTAVLPEPEVTDLNLTFRANFGDADLDFNTTSYDYEGMEMSISKFDFFISNVALYKNVDDNQEQTELFEIDFIDFTQNNNEVTILNQDLPVGEYDGIVFSIGVPSDLNSQIPGDFSSTHPLGFSNLSHYWADWNSYIFSKIEGRLMPAPGQDEVFFSYHTGSDDFFSGAIEKSLSLNLEVGVTKTINFEIDLQNIFLSGGALDIQTYPHSHSLSETTAATHVVNNYPNSITVN